MRAQVVLYFLASVAVVTRIAAQQPEGEMRRQQPSHPSQGSRGWGNPNMSPERAALERQVRLAFTKAARERVGLSEDQMTKLAAVNRSLSVQRRELSQEERATRLALRQEMLDQAPPDQAKIGTYLDRLRELRHRRLDIADTEQKELATFMTPSQRARYQALQEQVRHRLDDIRHQHPDQRLPSSIPNVHGASRWSGHAGR